MPTTSTPIWSAPHNGLMGDASAIAGTGAINQLLGTHGITAIYQGATILRPSGGQAQLWYVPLATDDIDQPFTMSGTTIGRVKIPILPVGDGADLLVSLCSDNSGAPGPVICQTRIPASWIYQLAAVSGISGPSTQVPATTYTGNQLALAQTNRYYAGLFQTTNWPYPWVTATAAASASYYGGYLIQIGGVVNSSTTITNVYTIPYSGTTLSPAIPQPAFPVTNDGSGKTCVVIDAQSGSPVVVNIGGGTSFGGAPVASVYTSNLTTATGSLSAWSQQTSLGYTVQNQGQCASPSGYVYVIGGKNGGGALNSVSYAQVLNGQITGWTAGIPLPIPTQLPFVSVVDNYLVVAGGATAGFSAYSNTWYAALNANGSYGNWQAGPPLHTAAYNLNVTNYASSFGIVTQAGGFSSVSIGPDGVNPEWAQTRLPNEGIYTAYADAGNGSITYFGLNSSSYTATEMALSPCVSVPLPATGLTNSATYHILMQQQGGDLNNYLRTHLDFAVFPGNPTGQTSPRAAYTWTAVGSGSAVPLELYDQTPPQTVMPGIPLHLWEDQGGKVTTLLTANSPDGRLLGACEATRKAYALNANTGFETGIAPWTVTGGTVTQSSTEAYAGTYSAQITPSGTAASVYLASEIMPCMPGQWCSAVGWAWFTASVSSAFSMSIAWFTATSGGTLVSTSSNPVSASAATWTQATNSFQAPSTAYGMQIRATLSSTPPSSQVWYLDTSHAHYTYTGPQTSTVTALEWSGQGWPSEGNPTGTTQLA